MTTTILNENGDPISGSDALAAEVMRLRASIERLEKGLLAVQYCIVGIPVGQRTATEQACLGRVSSELNQPEVL